MTNDDEVSELKVIVKWLKAQLIKKTAVIAQMKRQYRELRQKREAEIKSYSEGLKKANEACSDLWSRLRGKTARNLDEYEADKWQVFALGVAPKEEQMVLVSCGRGEETSVMTGYYDGEGFWILIDAASGFVRTGNVYAWQPFPPPKKLQSENAGRR